MRCTALCGIVWQSTKNWKKYLCSSQHHSPCICKFLSLPSAFDVNSHNQRKNHNLHTFMASSHQAAPCSIKSLWSISVCSGGTWKGSTQTQAKFLDVRSKVLKAVIHMQAWFHISSYPYSQDCTFFPVPVCWLVMAPSKFYNLEQYELICYSFHKILVDAACFTGILAMSVNLHMDLVPPQAHFHNWYL